MKEKTIHLIYVSEDGVATLCCGVGMIARHFITSFPHLKKYFEKRDIILRLYLISIHPLKDSIGVRNDFLKSAKKVCSQSGGRVYLISSLLRPTMNYFNLDVWKRYNKKINTLIRRITHDFDDHTIVIANDSIFAHVYGRGRWITNVWIPNSLAFVHRQSYADNDQRERWERDAIKRIKRDKRAYVGFVSPFVKKLLRGEFKLPNQKLVSFRNSFHIPKNDGQHFSPQEIIRVLKRRGIPTDKKIIFSFGRADEYKGLDLALMAINDWVDKHPDYFGVLIASRFSQGEIINVVQTHLREILGKDKNRVKLFLGYEFTLPKYLMQYSKTKFLLHLSSRDFCPLIPFEAQIFGHPELCVINSDIECFQGLIENNVNGFLAQTHLSDVNACLEEVDRMETLDRQRIITRGRRDALRKMNIVQNYAHGVAMVIKK